MLRVEHRNAGLTHSAAPAACSPLPILTAPRMPPLPLRTASLEAQRLGAHDGRVDEVEAQRVGAVLVNHLIGILQQRSGTAAIVSH